MIFLLSSVDDSLRFFFVDLDCLKAIFKIFLLFLKLKNMILIFFIWT